TGTFMDYAMPRADTFCDIQIGSNPVPTALNPMGAKGAGEAGTVGALPVVINAVLDALAPLGVHDFDMPATSARVWEAIPPVRAARGGPPWPTSAVRASARHGGQLRQEPGPDRNRGVPQRHAAGRLLHAGRARGGPRRGRDVRLRQRQG